MIETMFVLAKVCLDSLTSPVVGCGPGRSVAFDNFTFPPPIWAYQTFADLTGIIAGKPHMEPFLLNHFILLTASRSIESAPMQRKGITFSVWPDMFFQTCAGLGLFHLEAVDYTSPEGLIRKLRELLQKGNAVYCRAICDKFFIPRSAFFLRRHLAHPLLIIAVSSNRDILYCNTFLKDGTYGMVEISVYLFIRAINNRCAIAGAKKWKQDVFYAVIFNEGYKFDINIPLIRSQALDFLSGTAARTKLLFPDILPDDTNAFGVEAIELLRRHILACGATECIPDLRCTRMLMEHALLMQKRVRLLCSATKIDETIVRMSERLAKSCRLLHFSVVAMRETNLAGEKLVASIKDSAAMVPAIAEKYRELLTCMVRSIDQLA